MLLLVLKILEIISLKSANCIHSFLRIHPNFGDVGVIYEGKAVHAVHVKYSRPESYYHNYMGVYYTGV